MSRNPKIESILEIWWNAEHSHPDSRAAALDALNQALDAAIGSQPITRDSLQEYLYPRFLDYKRERNKREKISVAQAAGFGKPGK